TKTFVASLSAWLHLIAGWADLDALQAAIGRLPDRLAAAMRLGWNAAFKPLCEATSMVALGRGPPLRVAGGGRLEVEGAPEPSCRGVQQRRIPPWSDRARGIVISSSAVRPDRSCRSRPAGPRRGPSPQERERIRDWRTRTWRLTRAHPGSSRCGCGVPDSDL